jgi:hypothetical protein
MGCPLEHLCRYSHLWAILSLATIAKSPLDESGPELGYIEIGCGNAQPAIPSLDRPDLTIEEASRPHVVTSWPSGARIFVGGDGSFEAMILLISAVRRDFAWGLPGAQTSDVGPVITDVDPLFGGVRFAAPPLETPVQEPACRPAASGP